jgi:hypothetical protein
VCVCVGSVLLQAREGCHCGCDGSGQDLGHGRGLHGASYVFNHYRTTCCVFCSTYCGAFRVAVCGWVSAVASPRVLLVCCVRGAQTTHTYDILLASMRFQRLTIQKLSVYSPPVLSLFNSVFLTIFTISGTTIRIWSAVDGAIVSEFKQVTETVRTPLAGVPLSVSASVVGCAGHHLRVF